MLFFRPCFTILALLSLGNGLFSSEQPIDGPVSNQDRMPDWLIGCWRLSDGKNIPEVPTRNDAAKIQRLKINGLNQNYRISDLRSCSNIRDLSLNMVKLDQDAWGDLVSLQKLESLSIGTATGLIQDKDWVNLRLMTSLTSLTLQGSITNASLSPVWDLKHLRILTVMTDSSALSGGLTGIEGLPELEQITIMGIAGIQQDGLKALKGCKPLRRLVLVDFSVTPKMLSTLSTLTQLRELELIRCRVDESDGELKDHWPDFFKRLTLDRCLFTDQDIERLGGMKSLSYLRIARCGRINGNGLRVLERLTKLNICDFDALRIGDDDLKYIAQIEGLKRLRLSGCSRITNKGLLRFSNHSKLEFMDLALSSSVEPETLKPAFAARKVLLNFEPVDLDLEASMSDLRRQLGAVDENW